MGDRNYVRDRTLVLRVLVPSLEARLRDKMKDVEQEAIKAGKTAADISKEMLMDLDGVTCEPSESGSTLWHFHCDGATYPARLVNMPCPVELHKTHDHAMYYKSADLAQMLIVYEDQMALEEAEAASGYKSEGFPSYYHSGLTPPLKRVVERRFEARDHKAVAPPRTEVHDVEQELKKLIQRISKDTTKGSRSKAKTPSLATAQHANKVIEEITEDVVDYEPWMDDYGRTTGVEFDEKDNLCLKHPELWLEPDEVAQVTKAQTEKEDAAKKKKAEKTAKKKEKKAKKIKEEELEASKPSTKKGIPAKKSMEQVDEVTQAAALMSQMEGDEELNLEDLGFSFEDDDTFAGMNLDQLS